jgi:hypothetical protein
MKKIILLLIIPSIILFGCSRGCEEIPSKINYIRVGFPEHVDTYLRVDGSGEFSITYDDLVQQKYRNCSDYEVIANRISYFSVITEEEYNKNVGLTNSESIINN